MTRKIDFGALLGAQVSALVEAEADAAERTSEYIEAVGFEKHKDGTLSLRTVCFNMLRRDTDGTVRRHRVRIPALTLVPLPLLTVESAQIDFSARVEELRPRDKGDGKRGSAIAGAAAGARRRRLVTRLARTSRNDTTTKVDLDVSVKLAQSDFPVGIENLLNAADLSVQDESDE